MSQTSHSESPATTTKSPSYKWRTRTWERTPGFKGVPKRDLPVNPYSDSQWVNASQTARSPSTIYYHGNGTTSVIDPGGFYFTGGELANLRNSFENDYWGPAFLGKVNQRLIEAEVQLLNKVSDSKTNLGVMAAEARKTSDHLMDTVKRVASAYRSFRKGNLREVARHLHLNPKQSHKAWLEYKYAWMPLLMDVKNTAELFAQQAFYGGRRLRFQVDQKFEVVNDFQLQILYVPPGGGTPVPYTQTAAVRVPGRYHLWVEVVNPSIANLQQLGVTNPALVVWELIPFSFVFDWFISVGDWLTALTACHGLEIIKGYRSNIKAQRYTRSQQTTVRTDGAGQTWTWAGMDVVFETREYSRIKYVPSGLPPLPMKFDLGFAKLVTSLALIRAQNTRGLRV